MKKNELVNAVQLALDGGFTKKDIEAIITVLPEVIIDDLQENPESSTKLGPFTFKVKNVAERTFPAKTVTLRGEKVDIPEKTVEAHKELVVSVSKAVKSF